MPYFSLRKKMISKIISGYPNIYNFAICPMLRCSEMFEKTVSYLDVFNLAKLDLFLRHEINGCIRLPAIIFGSCNQPNMENNP